MAQENTMATLLRDVVTNQASLLVVNVGDSTNTRNGRSYDTEIVNGLISRLPYRGALQNYNAVSTGYNNGLLSVGRRNPFVNVGLNLTQPTSHKEGIAALGRFGFSTTFTAAPADATTTAGISIAAISWLPQSVGGTYYIRANSEVLSFTGTSGSGPYTLTGVTRAAYGTAQAHTNGDAVHFWVPFNGPVAASLPSLTIDGTGITSALVGATFTASTTPPAWWPTSAHVIRVNSEYMTVTRSGSVFTTTARGQYTNANEGGAAASTHAGGSIFATVAYDYSDALYLPYEWPGGIEGPIRVGTIYKSYNPSAPCSNLRMDFYGILDTNKPDGTINGGGFTTAGLGLGTRTNITSNVTPDATVSALWNVIPPAPMSAAIRNNNVTYTFTSMMAGTVLGPIAGPADLLFKAVVNDGQKWGLLDCSWWNLGGFSLQIQNQAIQSTPNSQDAIITLIKSARLACSSAIGCNDKLRIALCVDHGHNDGGGTAGFSTAWVNPNQTWTIGGQALLSVSILSNVTSIDVTDATNFPATGGVFLVDSERIYYTGKSGNTLTGCVRGVCGTTAAAHNGDATVYIGYQYWTANGFAANFYAHWKFYADALTAEGGNPATELYAFYVCPLPPCDTTEVVSGPITTSPQRQQRFREFVEAINRLRGIIPNLGVIDVNGVMTAAELIRAGHSDLASQGTITNTIDSSATTITTALNVGTSNFARIDNSDGTFEVVYVTNQTGAGPYTLTVQRRACNTTAVSHTSGDRLTAIDNLHYTTAGVRKGVQRWLDEYVPQTTSQLGTASFANIDGSNTIRNWDVR